MPCEKSCKNLIYQWYAHTLAKKDVLVGHQGIQKGKSDLSLTPGGAAAILTVTYGGELLYLRIWNKYLSRSLHIIVAVCFTVW